MTKLNEGTPAHAELGRAVGALEALLPNTFGKYTQERGLAQAIQDFENINAIFVRKAPVIFTGKYLHSSARQLPIDPRISALLEEDDGSSGTDYAIIPKNLPSPNMKNTSGVLMNTPHISKIHLETWVRFAELVANIAPYDKQTLNNNVASVQGFDSIVRHSFQKDVHKIKFASLKYNHMGESPYDNKVGIFATDLDKYRRFLEPALASFRKKHGKIIQQLNQEKFLASLEKEARQFNGESFDEPSSRPRH